MREGERDGSFTRVKDAGKGDFAVMGDKLLVRLLRPENFLKFCSKRRQILGYGFPEDI